MLEQHLELLACNNNFETSTTGRNIAAFDRLNASTHLKSFDSEIQITSADVFPNTVSPQQAS